MKKLLLWAGDGKWAGDDELRSLIEVSFSWSDMMNEEREEGVCGGRKVGQKRSCAVDDFSTLKKGDSCCPECLNIGIPNTRTRGFSRYFRRPSSLIFLSFLPHLTNFHPSLSLRFLWGYQRPPIWKGRTDHLLPSIPPFKKGPTSSKGLNSSFNGNAQ